MVNLSINWQNTLLLVVVVLLTAAYFIFDRPIGLTHNLETALDKHIPFVPAFIVPYVLFLPVFWLVVIYAFLSDKQFKALALAIIVVYLLSYLTYLLFQTHIPRPQVAGHDIFSKIVRFVYGRDRPYNGFPSTHSSLVTLLATYLVLIGSRYKWPMVIFAVLVVLSTLFVKQHYIPDAISGVLLGVVVMCISYHYLVSAPHS